MAELLYKVKHLEHIKLAIVVMGLNILSMAITQLTLNNGGYEINPAMRYLFEQSHWIAWVSKLGGVAIVMFAFLWCATIFPRLMKVIFISLVIFTIAICLHDSIGLIRLLTPF
jgi:hypothetical protein